MRELVSCQPHDNPSNCLGKDTDVLHAAAAFLRHIHLPKEPSKGR